VNGRADAETSGIVKVGDQRNLFRENAARATHQENQYRKNNRGEHDGKSDAKLGPFQLFLTRQGREQNNSMSS